LKEKWLIGRQSPDSLPLTHMVQTLFDSVENARLVEYKLHRLEHHLTISGRMLNDLCRLLRLLLDEADLSQPLPSRCVRMG